MAVGPGPKLLFRDKFGTVWVTIYGPLIGWEWTKVNYYRLVRSTKDPTKWVRRDADREVDQQNLEKAVKAVRSFYKDRDDRLKDNYGHPANL